MARRFWPAKDPIGERIVVESQDCQIIGVAEDVKINNIREALEPYMYLPFSQRPDAEATIIVETAQNPRLAEAGIRSEILSLDPRVQSTVFQAIIQRPQK